MISKTLGELAELVGGELVGDASLAVTDVAHPALATPNQLALVMDEGVLPLLAHKTITTALVASNLSTDAIANQIRVERPKVALAYLLDVFDKPAYAPPGIHPSAVVDPTAHIGDGVTIGPLCIVGPNSVIGAGSRLLGNVYIGADVTLGENCRFFPGVYVGDRIQIGNRVILHPNASIGGDGFSHVTKEAGSVDSGKVRLSNEAQNNEIIRINSVGNVVLEDDVEIGANSCVDRGALGDTRIKKSTKIDNLCQVAHNVTIGENCLLAAGVGVAGSTKVGNRVVMGGKAGIPDHITIGDDAIIMSMSGLSESVEPKTVMMGYPALPLREFARKEMQIKRIKNLTDKVSTLTAKLDALEARLGEQKAEQPV